MDDDQVPIDTLTDLLLPAALRNELCVAGITSGLDHELLTFRIDPGGAFERRGYIRRGGSGHFLLGLSERYLPDGDRTHVCGCDGLPAADVPDQLMAVSGWAYAWDRARDHWREARRAVAPATAVASKDTEAAIRLAVHTARQLASAERLTHYMHARSGKVVYGNNPPAGEAPFISVTVRGDWALHVGRETYPLDGVPDPAVFRAAMCGRSPRPAGEPVRIAQVEHPWESAAVVVPIRSRSGNATQSATRKGL